MLELDEALALLMDLGLDRRCGTERVDLQDVLHRVVAEDVLSDIDLPPFTRSTRDGFACRRSDLGNDLEIVETIPAGAVPRRSIGPNQCAKIMTGAAIPPGADWVVMLEHVEHLSDVCLRSRVGRPEDNIRRRGARVTAGEAVLRAGEIVKPQHIAVLAEVRCCRPLVSRRPTVGVIATGSELVAPGHRPGSCQIRNSNSFQLSALVISASAVPCNYGLVPDDRDAIRAALRQAMIENDVVVLSGGISKGDFDLVRDVLAESAIELLFDRVDAAPGRPVLFGVSDSASCFGLSGNPVSNFIMFELIVKPFLYAMAGHRFRPTVLRGELAEPMHRRRTDKDLWLPVVMADDGRVRPIECPGSRGIHALCRANGMVHVPAGVAGFPKGTTVVVRTI